MSYVNIESGTLSGVRTPRDLGFGRAHSWPRGGSLHGLSGPLKLTIEHLGRVERSFAGLGDAQTATQGDAEARRKALENLTTLVAKWRTELDSAIKNLPTFPIVTMLQLKGWLKDARTKLDSQVLPVGTSTINDAQLPLSEVLRRVAAFTKGYYEELSKQMTNAEVSARSRSMKGQLDEFTTALSDLAAALAEKLGQGAGKVANAATKGVGTGAVVAMGLVGVGLLAYAWRSFR